MVVLGLPPAALARLDGARLAGPDGQALLVVRTAAAGDDLPAVLGARRVAGGALRFVPRLPFRPGLAYRARFDGAVFDRLTGSPAGTTADLQVRFAPPPAGGAATRVEAVYPSADVLPENQLRLYVWFSAPMRRRGIGEGIRLVDAESGEEVGEPFVEIADGLWDPSGRRLTVFFHPGRVKRGVGPRLAMGPPIRQGGRYRLEIDASLRDATGGTLAAGHAKAFSVGPPDRRSPRPSDWRLAPPPGPRAPLVVDFSEPLDHGLLLRLLRVVDASGDEVAGEVAIGHGEKRWSFVPRDPWRPGAYALRVATSLEDLAGNTPDRLFDEATATAREPRPPSRKRVELPFQVGATARR